MMTTYYVTAEGVAATLHSPENLAVIRRAILSRRSVRRCREAGWIAPDRRGNPELRTDFTDLVLSKAVEKVVAPKAEPRPLVRYQLTGKKRASKPLPPIVEKVYRTLTKVPEGATLPELVAALPGVARNSIRWSVRQLQIAKLARSVKV